VPRRGLLVALAMAVFAVSDASAAGRTWFDWRTVPDAGARTYHADGVTLTLSTRHDKDKDEPIPTLTIHAPGVRDLTLTGAKSFEVPPALVGVVRLDPGARLPQVVFMSYSGGAHCCTSLQVAIATGGAWTSRELGYDGAPVKDVVASAGAPARLQLVVTDDAFDYAFASHGGGYPVLRVYSVRDGRLFDVTGEPQFRAFHRRQLAGALKKCRGPSERNGGCAAYVAEASLAGLHDVAWKRMLASYDRLSTLWPSGCRIDPGEAGCPKDQQLTFKDFPSALEWFLWRYGYHPVAPSFACERVRCPVTPPSRPFSAP
jgi:hypothetical protein